MSDDKTLDHAVRDLGVAVARTAEVRFARRMLDRFAALLAPQAEAPMSERCPSRDDDRPYAPNDHHGDGGPFRLFYQRHKVPWFADYSTRELAESIADYWSEDGYAMVVCLQDARSGEVLVDYLARYHDGQSAIPE